MKEDRKKVMFERTGGTMVKLDNRFPITKSIIDANYDQIISYKKEHSFWNTKYPIELKEDYWYKVFKELSLKTMGYRGEKSIWNVVFYMENKYGSQRMVAEIKCVEIYIDKGNGVMVSNRKL